MEFATVIFLAIWLMVFCLAAYRQLTKEFKSYIKDKDEKNNE